MKKLFYPLLVILIFASCESEPASSQQDELIGISAKAKKGKKTKVDVCHKGKIINISSNALNAHLNHGDVALMDNDGDGYVSDENECGVLFGDCDDSNVEINPGIEEICYNDIDDNCDGEVDEDCVFPAFIGQFRDGGVVFWVDPDDDTHGLVCDVSDMGEFPWGCFETYIVGADGTAIGTGEQNTLDILAGCSEGNIAARICAESTNGGFSDWFLPSRDELNQMYINKDAIDLTAIANGGSGFGFNHYWSSTGPFIYDAWEQDFEDGFQNFNARGYVTSVRAIRVF